MNKIPDLGVRKEVLDPLRSFILVAPAGAGKTQVLVKRYLTLLKEASSVDSIVALTFTNKAAEEMKGRIFSALARAGGKGRDENEEELLSIAGEVMKNGRIPREELFSPSSFRISTFHGFCSDLLRSYPLEAGVSPGFTVYEDFEAEEAFRALAEEVVSRALHEKGGEAFRAVSRRLAALGGRSADLIEQIAALVRDRDRAGLSPKMGFKRREEMVGYILEQYGKETRNHLLRNAGRFGELAGTLGLSTEIPPLDRANLQKWERIAGIFLTKGGDPRKEGGLTPKNGFPPGFKGSASADFLLSLPGPCAEELKNLSDLASKSKYEIDESAYKDLGVLLEKALDIYIRGTLQEKLDFVEMETRAVKALSSDSGAPTKAMSRLHAAVRHILVDEAQDLGDMELEIISRLAEGWEPGDGCSVFIVGDPKQSIYRFRKANVAIFNRLMESGLPRLSERPLPLEMKELRVNFRSEPGIIDFVNGLFEPLMTPKPFLDGVEFSGFVHPSSPGASPVFMNAKEGSGKGPVTVAAFREKENLLGWFAGEVKKVLSCADEKEEVALLYHRRSAFQPYLNALQEEGIAINVVDGDKLLDLPAVNHLLNLLKAVLCPADDLSWALALGAPWFDLGPAEILELSRAEGAWSERVLDCAFIEKEKLDALKECIGLFPAVPGGKAFWELWMRLDGPGHYSSLYGLKGVEQARLFFSLLEEVSFMPGPGLVKRLELGLSSRYSGPDPEASVSKLRAMTVHKAKGLEFDTVFVVGLDADPKRKAREGDKPPLVVERLKFDEETQRFEFYDAPYEKNELCYEILRDLDAKRGEEEFLRLNYVALTRAKKRLYLVGDAKRANKHSFLKKIMDRFDIKVEESPVDEKERGPKPERKRRRIEQAAPMSFVPVPPPFSIVRASEQVAIIEESAVPQAAGEEESRIPRLRGIAIHRVLERLAKGGELPAEKALGAWLLWNREPLDERFVKEVLSEAESAWNCEAMKQLTRNGELLPEYGIEMRSGEKEITVGRLDLVIKKDGDAHIIDYKTGAPGENGEEWMKRKTEEYRPQVATYKKMIAAKEGIAEERIKAFLLFTKVGVVREV